jgi:chromosome segregation ATPase
MISNKMPLEWHEGCLKNRKFYLEEIKNQIEDLKSQVSRREREIQFYEMQITKAKKRKLEGFDSDRFLVPRSVKK